jgi:hypothetical protein
MLTATNRPDAPERERDIREYLANMHFRFARNGVEYTLRWVDQFWELDPKSRDLVNAFIFEGRGGPRWKLTDAILDAFRRSGRTAQ